MASTIKLKNSTSTGNVPASLSQGEVAINVADGVWYYGGASSVKQDFKFGAVTVTGDTSLDGKLVVTGNTVMNGTLSAVTSITTSGDITAGDDIYTDTIRRQSDSSTTTKILLNDEVLKFNAGHSSNETLKLQQNAATLTGTLTATQIKAERSFTNLGAEAGDGEGDIVSFGDGDSLTPGALYYYDGAAWALADSSAVSTSTKLLGVAKSDSPSEGMMLRGLVTMSSTPGGSDGDVIYISETAGRVTTTAPTTSAAVVRAVGVALDTSASQIWFNPDNTWVELS